MNRELTAYQRLLLIAYERYLETDLRLAQAMNDMRGFFPVNRMPYRDTIGAPGSRVRRLHDDRDRALLRLQSAYEKFKAAKTRAERRTRHQAETYLITATLS